MKPATNCNTETPLDRGLKWLLESGAAPEEFRKYFRSLLTGESGGSITPAVPAEPGNGAGEFCRRIQNISDK